MNVNRPPGYYLGVDDVGVDDVSVGAPEDSVDRIVRQWAAVRPEIDVSPIEIVGRVSRWSRMIDRRLAENFARFGIENWMYDVLATLRRTGEPYELTAGDLVRQTMVTTGAMTNRIDRLEQRGLVERRPAPDRRSVIVRLTGTGVGLVDEIVESHMDVERDLLSALNERQRRDLALVLRCVLLSLGDLPPGA
jgi:DNA-binding MarR family transcriptional regulator